MSWLQALEENRMMIMRISSRLAGNLASAEERNRFVLKHADEMWLPYVTSGGVVERLVKRGENGTRRNQHAQPQF